MTEKRTIEIGTKIGRWTVLEKPVVSENGQKKCLCRCACGTKRYVLERSLRYGGSNSCGCLRREETRKVIALDLAGKSFGELTVLHRAAHQRKNGGIWWTCQCSCGNLYDVSGSLLVNGKRTHCSGKSHERNYASMDITGKKFHRLTALYPTEKRDARGSVVWHCRCECGTELDVAYNSLVHCNMKSCGCQKKEHSQKLHGFLTHTAGTSIDMLKSKKIPTDNTTGYRGVYFIKGKYVAKIVFQKKAYYLGNYEKIEEAAAARKEAEEQLFGETAQFYDKWKVRADADPAWAEENPMHIFVEKDTGGRLKVSYLPVL